MARRALEVLIGTNLVLALIQQWMIPSVVNSLLPFTVKTHILFIKYNIVHCIFNIEIWSLTFEHWNLNTDIWTLKFEHRNIWTFSVDFLLICVTLAFSSELPMLLTKLTHCENNVQSCKIPSYRTYYNDLINFISVLEIDDDFIQALYYVAVLSKWNESL